MMGPPPIIVSTGLCGAPVTYEWSTEISDVIRFPFDEKHPRLAHALSLCAPDAIYAFSVALGEWAVWRYDGMVDLSDAVRRLEIGYRAIEELQTPPPGRPTEPFPKEMRNVHGPLKLARILIGDAHEHHVRHDTAVYAIAFSLGLLALHVTNECPELVEWMERSLRRCHETHPRTPLEAATGAKLDRAFFFAGVDAAATR